jgi:cytoskeleton protein RodZ
VTDGELHKLGEVLRTAREAKGVDLARVERDTKIRVRYLTALETGDYAELPGAVYTKGFLRNYGAYLGLDVEYLVDLYRLESAQPTWWSRRA